MFRMMARRLACMILVTTALALGACGDDDNAPPTAPGETRSEEATLVVGVSSEGAGLFFGATWGLGFDVGFNAHDQLMTFDREGQLIPSVAETVETSDDGKRVVYDLREDVTFSSGRGLTANDIKWSFQLHRDCPGYSSFDYPSFHLDDAVAEVVDEHTVVLNMPQGSTRNTIPFLSTQYLILWDSETVASNTGVPVDLDSFDDAQCTAAIEWLTENVAGSGPYVLESKKPGEELVLKAREDYWGGKPYFDRVVFRIVPDPNTRFLLLKQGAIDVAWEIPPEKWPEIEADSNLSLNLGRRTNDPYYLAFQTKVEPFDDLNLRKALIKAWPYETVVKEVLHGFGDVADSWVLPDDPTHEPVDLYSQDLGEARQLLEQSDYTPGTPITLSINADNPIMKDAAVWYQSALNEIGVPLEIQALPLAQWTEKRVARELPFHIHVPEPWLPGLHYELRLNWYSAGAGNFANFENARLDEIIEEVQAILDPDSPKVDELLQEALDIMANEAPGAPLFFVGNAMPSKADISGYYFVYYSPGMDLRQLGR
jgi:peptide/nickel transport system substrate-binding protein